MHCVRNVTENLYSVGADDHRIQLFENIHPISKGVSYNAYVLLDEKTVLFDTVDWAVCRQFMENIAFVLDGKPLDYMVINHMEPDHAACLEQILLVYPQVKIISNDKAFSYMKQFGFRVDDANCIRVKEGDTQSFGKHNVTFVMAPMVHWPEAMVCFDTTSGVLFSADAFGTFGALNGVLFNDEVDFQRDWMDEARRYYTNIVGKFGPQVQTLLKKASGLPIQYICPLHGPVWRNNFELFIEKYLRWSSYTPEKKGILIVYASMYGSTEAAAVALASQLIQKGCLEVKVCDVSTTDTSELISMTFQYSHLVLAGVTYNMGIFPKLHDFLADMKALNLQNRTVALIENGTWACTVGKLMAKELEGMKNMRILEENVSLLSVLNDSKMADLENLANALIQSVNETTV